MPADPLGRYEDRDPVGAAAQHANVVGVHAIDLGAVEHREHGDDPGATIGGGLWTAQNAKLRRLSWWYWAEGIPWIASAFGAEDWLPAAGRCERAPSHDQHTQSK